MATFTYSDDMATMVAQYVATDNAMSKKRDEVTLAKFLLLASWKRANPFMTQKEFAKESGIPTAEVSKGIQVLEHYDVLSTSVESSDVVKATRAFMKHHVGERGFCKTLSGIYTDLFGTEDKWTLEGAIDTLLKAADKRGIDREVVLATFVEACEG